jgi:hypothetical protein
MLQVGGLAAPLSQCWLPVHGAPAAPGCDQRASVCFGIIHRFAVGGDVEARDHPSKRQYRGHQTGFDVSNLLLIFLLS